MKRILKKAIAKFGMQRQTDKAIEELSELIRAIVRDDNDNILEEIADVEIMIAQLKIIFKFKQTKIDDIKKYKIERLEGILWIWE